MGLQMEARPADEGAWDGNLSALRLLSEKEAGRASPLLRSKSVLKSAPGETAPAAARPTAAARLDTPARPGRDLLRALSGQLAREGSSHKTAPATGSARHIWAAALRSPRPYTCPRGADLELLARQAPSTAARARAPRVPKPSGPQSAARLSCGAENRPVSSPAPGGPVRSQYACSSHPALHNPTSGTWAGATTAGLLGDPVRTFSIPSFLKETLVLDPKPHTRTCTQTTPEEGDAQQILTAAVPAKPGGTPRDAH